MKYIFASKLFIFRALPTRDVPCKLRGTLALLNLPIGRLWDLEDSKQTDRSTVRRFLLKTFWSRSMLAFSCSTWLHKSFSTFHTFVVFHLQIHFQRWQWCTSCSDITPLCLFMWTDSCWLCVNCFGQREQWKSLIPRWIFSCDLSTCFFLRGIDGLTSAHAGQRRICRIRQIHIWTVSLPCVSQYDASGNTCCCTCKQDMFEGKHLNIDFTSSHRLDTRPLPRRTLTAPCDLKGLTGCRTSGCKHHIDDFLCPCATACEEPSFYGFWTSCHTRNRQIHPDSLSLCAVQCDEQSILIDRTWSLLLCISCHSFRMDTLSSPPSRESPPRASCILSCLQKVCHRYGNSSWCRHFRELFSFYLVCSSC